MQEYRPDMVQKKFTVPMKDIGDSSTNNADFVDGQNEPHDTPDQKPFIGRVLRKERHEYYDDMQVLPIGGSSQTKEFIGRHCSYFSVWPFENNFSCTCGGLSHLTILKAYFPQ